MKKNKQLDWLTLCLAAIVGLLLLAGCGAGQGAGNEDSDDGRLATVTPEPEGSLQADETKEPDLRGRSLRIAQIGNMTGRGSEFVLPLMRGVEDAVAYTNREGGVWGAAIALETWDSQGNLELTRQLLLSWEVDERPDLLLLLDPELATGLRATLEVMRIPAVTTFLPYEPTRPEDEFVFGLMAPPEAELVFLARYLDAHWDEFRPTDTATELRLGVFSWPNFFGESGLTPTARRQLQLLGIPIVYETEFNATYTEDVQPLLRAAERAEVNVLFVQGYAYGPAVVLDDLYWLGLQDRMLVVGPGAALDTNVYGYLTRPEYFNGFMAATGVTWWSLKTHPGIVTSEVLFEQNDRTPGDRSRGRLIGQAMLDFVRQAFMDSFLRLEPEQSVQDELLALLRENYQMNLFEDLLKVERPDSPGLAGYLRIWQVASPSVFVPLTELERFIYPER